MLDSIFFLGLHVRKNSSKMILIGWIQTLFREIVKSQRLGNRTFNSEHLRSFDGKTSSKWTEI